MIVSSMLDALPAIACLLDRDGEIVAVNKAWMRFAADNDGQPRRCGVGANYLAVCPQGVAEGMADVMAGRLDRFEQVYPCHSPVSERWFKMVAAGLVGEAAVLVMHVDVTDLFQCQDDLRSALRLTSQADRSRAAFLSNMSHELRTPLNAILGFTDLMASEMLGPLGHPRYRSYMQDVRASAQHLLGIVNDLLDAARLEQDSMVLNQALHDPNEILREALQIFWPLAAHRNQQLVCALRPVPRLRCDARRLRQMVINLISNAWKYTPDGGCLQVETALAATGCLVITVTDNGVGIAPEDVDLAFSPFGRIRNAGAEDVEGTGLGLPLVRAFARLHDAELLVDSEVGRGTRVSLRFPAERLE